MGGLQLECCFGLVAVWLVLLFPFALADGPALQDDAEVLPASAQGHCVLQHAIERETTDAEIKELLMTNAFPVDDSYPVEDQADSNAGAKEKSEEEFQKSLPLALIALGAPDHPKSEHGHGTDQGSNDVGGTDGNAYYQGFGEKSMLPPDKEKSKGVVSGFKSPRAMRAGKSKVAAEEHDGGEHGHHSIFRMRFQTLDQPMFWIVWFGMIGFTILVDRAQAYAAYHARHSQTEQMFLSRINAELMMFGCVGLGLFLCTNLIGDVPLEYFSIFEFTDIMCSCGAFGIIVVALVLYSMRRMQENKWSAYERMALQGANSRAQHSSVADSPREPEMAEEVVDHQRMAAEFIRIHMLPAEFEYSEYLKECLASNAVDLIDVQWTTWALVLVWAILGLSVRLLHEQPLPSRFYLLFFVVANYSCFFMHLALVVSIHRAHATLSMELRNSKGTGKSPCSVSGASAVNKKWVCATKWGMQGSTLLNSFLATFYGMQIVYNINVEECAWFWHPILAAPIVINLIFCLPHMLSRLTLVQAIYAPNEDALEHALESLSRYADDLRYLGRVWHMKKRPPLPEFSEAVTELQFAEQLRATGLLLSSTRMHRLFRHFDSDHNGDLGVQECAKMMQDIREQADKEEPLKTASVVSFANPMSPRSARKG